MQRRKQVELASLPPDQLPAAGRGGRADDLLHATPEFHYRFGVDLFIAGVRALAPQP